MVSMRAIRCRFRTAVACGTPCEFKSCEFPEVVATEDCDTLDLRLLLLLKHRSSVCPVFLQLLHLISWRDDKLRQVFLFLGQFLRK